jgi:hypothetical protein
LSGGAIAYQGRTVPTGSMLSLGFNWAQIDIGYRDHWFSPATDSSMLMSTEAPTTPSVTLSNYEPLTRLGFQYEFFADAPVPERSDTFFTMARQSSGTPRLFGTQLSIEPFPGWSLGINRLLEYGGGGGLPDSARFLAAGLLQAQRLVADTGQPAGLLRQPLHLSGQDTVCRVFSICRRGQLRRRQLPARQCGAHGRHRYSAPRALLRSHL